MLMTMSISTAPSRQAVSVSNRLTSVVLPPCGKPTTQPTFTPLPRSSSTARATAYGLMQTDATLYSAATAQPASSSASVIVGCNSE